MFSRGYGFVVDYLAEILRNLRSYDFSQKYQQYFDLSDDMSTRDRDGINKSFSGLMKILFPAGEASKEDMEMLLAFSIEGRKRIKDQLMRIDNTYAEVTFVYKVQQDNTEVGIQTAEEKRYPQHYYQRIANQTDKKVLPVSATAKAPDATLSEEERLIQGGETAKLEFKSTLRWNILGNRIDKEMERSVLKTIVAYMNSEGGTLLVGVKDNGDILGIELDEFPNEDKYLLHFSNLINDRIGKQFIDQIQYALKTVDAEKILRVDCKPSSVPVFLKDNDREEFFVRNGPSSVQLATSEVLEYSRKHFR
jgi:hypothetical protein